MKRIAILGSTGSIGQNTLGVIRNFPDRFKVVALSTNGNVKIIRQQIREFSPQFVCVRDKEAALNLKSKIKSSQVKLLAGEEGLEALVREKQIDKVVLAISGSAALLPLLNAIDSGKDVALANKEALVMAGPIIVRQARTKKTMIIPVDSEQSAIWQCLDGEDKSKLKNIYLTASGGPFRNAPKKDFKNISVKRVLRHPTWKMGRKISVDSATMMNKGLEVLETMFLFDVGVEKIKVVIHPESIIHSMVEFIDGVVIAQLSATDMRIPIQYALSYPQRLPSGLTSMDFYKLGKLNFEKPQFSRFPCLGLAYRVAREGGAAPCALNAANEVCVEEFLNKRLDFISIPKVIEKVLGKHKNIGNPDLNDILATDSWARQEAQRIIHN